MCSCSLKVCTCLFLKKGVPYKKSHFSLTQSFISLKKCGKGDARRFISLKKYRKGDARRFISLRKCGKVDAPSAISLDKWCVDWAISGSRMWGYKIINEYVGFVLKGYGIE
jgi:hypothetical protein